jgi:hypothetical protein
MGTVSRPVSFTSTGHGKPGMLYCDITRKGCIAVAGDTANIAHGEGMTLADCNSSTRRNG